MGVDYNYCSSCDECISEYCFYCFCLCGERADYCEDCNDDHLVIFNKNSQHLCDDCIPWIGEDNYYEDDKLRINAMAEDYKMSSISIMEVLSSEYKKRTHTKNMKKLEKLVKNLKIPIRDQLAIIGTESLKIPYNGS